MGMYVSRGWGSGKGGTLRKRGAMDEATYRGSRLYRLLVSPQFLHLWRLIILVDIADRLSHTLRRLIERRENTIESF